MVAQATGGRRQLSCPRFDAASRKATLACHAPSEGTVTGNPLLGRRDPGTGGDGDCATNITVTPAPAPATQRQERRRMSSGAAEPARAAARRAAPRLAAPARPRRARGRAPPTRRRAPPRRQITAREGRPRHIRGPAPRLAATRPLSCEAARAAPAGRFRARAAAGRGGGDAPARAERPQRASQLRAPREEGGPALRHI